MGGKEISKQGYKSDVSQKAGIHLVVSWETIPLILTYNNVQVMPFLYRHNKAISDYGKQISSYSHGIK